MIFLVKGKVYKLQGFLPLMNNHNVWEYSYTEYNLVDCKIKEEAVKKFKGYYKKKFKKEKLKLQMNDCELAETIT